MGKYSTFGPRFWAGFIDGLVFLPVTLLDDYLSAPARAASVLILWAVFSYSAYWIYSVALHAYRGQTVGKKSQHVKVMDVSEERVPSLNQALVRDIGTIISSSCCLAYFSYLVLSHRYYGMEALQNHWVWRVLAAANLVWFLVEITTMWANPKRRAFHDLIARTVVIRVPDERQLSTT